MQFLPVCIDFPFASTPQSSNLLTSLHLAFNFVHFYENVVVVKLVSKIL